MPEKLHKPRILVISPSIDSKRYMTDFFERMPYPEPVFEVNKLVPADRFDFIIFDAHTMPEVRDNESFIKLPDQVQDYFFLLEKLIRDTNKYILYFGKYYHNLNPERCPSANTKFTLFARMRELMDFMNYYRTD